jgi:hypothetical protein
MKSAVTIVQLIPTADLSATWAANAMEILSERCDTVGERTLIASASQAFEAGKVQQALGVSVILTPGVSDAWGVAGEHTIVWSEGA